MIHPLAASVLVLLLMAGCTPSPPGTEETAAPLASTQRSSPAASIPSPPLVVAARQQIGVTLRYDPAYVDLAYPDGDVPQDRGVCTDVVVRALRRQGIDLQRALHEDMRANFAQYPRQWGLNAPDRNIDHRRVPNQMRWFERQGWARPISIVAGHYDAGDIVAWKLSGSGLLHVGIVSDRRTPGGTPLILHNIGSGTQESDILFAHQIIGHYRPDFAARR